MKTKQAFFLVAAFLFMAASAHAAPGGYSMDWGQELVKGGITVLVQIILSAFAVGFTLERFVRLRRNRIVPPKLAPKATALWKEKRYDEIMDLCAKDKSLLASTLAFAVEMRDHDYGFISAGCGDIASAGIKAHQQAAYPLAVVATLQPLLGLLGTVIGMIEAFQIVSIAGSMGDASILADSIAKALITTAVGLAFAIPALGLYHFFRIKTGKLSLQLERVTNQTLITWFKSAAPHPDETVAKISDSL